jgi:hypothetical protein
MCVRGAAHIVVRLERSWSLFEAALLQNSAKSVASPIPSAIFSRNNSPHSISARSSQVESGSSPFWTPITIVLSRRVTQERAHEILSYGYQYRSAAHFAAVPLTPAGPKVSPARSARIDPTISSRRAASGRVPFPSLKTPLNLSRRRGCNCSLRPGSSS